MKCPHCGKSLWFVRTSCPFCEARIEAPKCPRSVMVVGWAFLALNCAALLVMAFIYPSEEQQYLARLRSNHPWQWTFFFFGPVFSILASSCVLLGHNWARWALTTYLGLNVLVSVAHGSGLHFSNGFPLPLILARLSLFFAAAYFLFRPKARAYFLGQSSALPPSNEKDGC